MQKQLFIIAIFVLSILSGGVRAEDLTKLVSLTGQWKFSIGDEENWKNPSFDDSNWDRINVPGAWENQGFYGYDGYAWYRTRFFLNDDVGPLPIFLDMGIIDDIDEVYVNGHLVGGKGSFPPKYSTAYNVHRQYHIPHNILNKNGENHIAVKVYDEWSAGGILSGNIGIYINKNALPITVNLSGKWKFKTTSFDPDFNANIDFKNWKDINVPSAWEDNGYKGYDGYAIYAKTFRLANEFTNKDVVLLLGKIDDCDQVYINGKLIGQHGKWEKQDRREEQTYYNEVRGYYLPKGVLKNNATNTIIVRVNDIGGTGGIYSGQIGLITQQNYIKHWHSKREPSFWY